MEKNQFEIGETVIVIKKLPDYNWDDTWVPDMDNFVGKICTIVAIGSTRVRLKIDTNNTQLNFPLTSIIKKDTSSLDILFLTMGYDI